MHIGVISLVLYAFRTSHALWLARHGWCVTSLAFVFVDQLRNHRPVVTLSCAVLSQLRRCGITAGKCVSVNALPAQCGIERKSRLLGFRVADSRRSTAIWAAAVGGIALARLHDGWGMHRRTVGRTTCWLARPEHATRASASECVMCGRLKCVLRASMDSNMRLAGAVGVGVVPTLERYRSLSCVL